MMANNFGFCGAKTNELPRRFDSPGFPSSLGDNLEKILAMNAGIINPYYVATV
jgi:hypothetical protein